MISEQFKRRMESLVAKHPYRFSNMWETYIERLYSPKYLIRLSRYFAHPVDYFSPFTNSVYISRAK